MRRPTRRGLVALLTAASVLLLSAALPADEPPQVDKDGLKLVKRTKERLVYLRDGASFSQYHKIQVLDCYVEFQKNWQRDYNSDTSSLSQRVNDSDIERMKKGLADMFKKAFTEELSKNGGYTIVDAAGPDVLVLRPALINVTVTAPDIMSANVRAVVVRSAGSATLYLELWDSASNTILARVADSQSDYQPIPQRASGVTNVAAADTMMRDWAKQLRQHLEAARSQTPAS